MKSIEAMPKKIPPQHQNKQPGIENKMHPKPIYDNDEKGYGRLRGKVAIITGGDSGIGRAVAVSFAREGADSVIVYLDEHEDAKQTQKDIQKYGKEALLIATDISKEKNCKKIVEKALEKFGHIDILVNNAGIQYPQKEIQDISAKQVEHTFSVNIFSHFYLTKYAVPHLKDGSCIINTGSVTSYKGNEVLLDYSSTKGAITAFTRSLAQSLAEKGIRVNSVAPGPVWTPLIPSSFDKKKVAKFGKNTLKRRPAQPVEIAPSYVFLASKESAFITGQTLHPNGGTIVNG